MKQMSGTENPIAILSSPTTPIKIADGAPPATAIVRNEAPFLVFSPKPDKPNAYIVGNMIDIKKKLTHKAIIDTCPRLRTTRAIHSIHTTEYIANSLFVAKRAIKKLPEKRPNINRAIPPKARN